MDQLEGSDRTDLDAARDAKGVLAEYLDGTEGVTGVGLARDDSGAYALRVNLVSEGIDLSLPALVRGFPVECEVTGAISAGGSAQPVL
jgi:hypothetical protein